MRRFSRSLIRPVASRSASLLALCRHARSVSSISRLPKTARPALVFPAFQPVRRFATLPDHVKLQMPALSPTMTSGTIAKWNKKEGDQIKAGEVMAEVETDKATVAFEAVEPGILAKILVPSGSKDVQIGQIVAIIVEEPSAVAAFKDFTLGATATPSAAPAAAPASTHASTPAPTPAPTPSAAPASAPASGDKVVASPLAKKIATEAGVNLSQITGTGPNRRIVRADVEDYLASGAAKQAAPVSTTAAAPTPAPAAEGAFRDIPHSNVRKVIAQRLLFSKQSIPHYYLTVDVTVDKLLKLRSDLNAKLDKAQKLSVNDFIIKASAMALRKVPAVNASWMDNVIREYNYVDISVAVQTDTGLITPIVKDADLKGLSGISKDVKDLAGRARQNKLKPEEYQGGTFTISNLGMFGIKQFAAIINPPQSCILAVGTTEARVVPNSSAKAGENPFTTVNTLTVTLSCDHRVVDGAVGAQWLAAFKGYLEEPSTMLL